MIPGGLPPIPGTTGLDVAAAGWEKKNELLRDIGTVESACEATYNIWLKFRCFKCTRVTKTDVFGEIWDVDLYTESQDRWMVVRDRNVSSDMKWVLQRRELGAERWTRVARKALKYLAQKGCCK